METPLDDLTIVRSELREIITEQHQGKWLFNGNPDDKEACEAHEEWVRGRINRGIQLTAIERGISTAPKPRAKGSRAAKESIAAAITEDLLS